MNLKKLQALASEAIKILHNEVLWKYDKDILKNYKLKRTASKKPGPAPTLVVVSGHSGPAKKSVEDSPELSNLTFLNVSVETDV